MNTNSTKLSSVFRNEGLRLTRQRQAVWDEVKSSKDHLDAENIYEKIKNKGVHISRATVYRTIDVLVKNNLLSKMNMGDGRNRYELKDEDHHHDHMICIETGKIIEFFDNDLEMLQDKIAKKHGYKVIRHIHQLFVKPLK